MTSGTEELFKALFAVAIFGCAGGLVRLTLLEQLDARIKLVLGSFLALMLLPTTYLYMRLAFPSSAATLIPFQSMAIWVYGPLLMAVLHVVANRRMNGWLIAMLAAPLVFNIVVQFAFFTRQRPLPAWWELLGFAQASAFAVMAIALTLRARKQLRVVLRGFPGSSFAVLLYLSAGLLALLLADLFVHWRFYAGLPLNPLTFYLVVTPCAMYALAISMVLIWRNATEVAAIEDVSVPAPIPQIPASESPKVSAPTRSLELSPAAARELELHLHGLMREKGLYKRNDLTLVDLATELRVSTHLASELLNAHLSSSFYEFLNRHRTEEAARLLRARKGKLSIADIAYQAGFNNHNTFYREFKRAHGVTPAQFRKAEAAAIPRRSIGSVDEGAVQ